MATAGCAFEWPDIGGSYVWQRELTGFFRSKSCAKKGLPEEMSKP
jgi:hypothetical protein